MNLERLKELEERFDQGVDQMSKEDVVSFTKLMLKSYISSEEGHEVAAKLYHDLVSKRLEEKEGTKE